MPQKILVIDDDANLRKMVHKFLTDSGLNVVHTDNGSEGLLLARESHPDLVLVDAEMPGLDGYSFCRVLKKEDFAASIGVIVMSGKFVGEKDVVTGLECGADDYVLKPFSLQVLLARIKAVLRRAAGGPAALARVLSFGGEDLLIDNPAMQARKGGAEVDLTPTEFRLLSVLAASPGRVFSREELITHALGPDFTGFDRTIDAHVKNLRQKIETDPRDPRYILTVHGLGYRFQAEEGP